MKKILGMILVLCLCVSIAACGQPAEKDNSSTNPPDASATAPSTDPSADNTSDAEEQPEVTIRIAHQSTENTEIHLGLAKLAELLEAADVNFKVEMYPNKQLVGSDPDAIEAVELGEIDVTSVAEMQFATTCEAFYVFNANYLFDGVDDAEAKLGAGSELGAALRQAAIDGGYGCQVAAFFGGSPRGFFTTKKQVVTPADMAGLKIRSADNPINIAELEAMGSSTVIIAGGELYTAFQQGAADGYISAITSHVNSGWLDVAPYCVDTMQTIYIPTILVNTAKLESMTDVQRAAWDKAVDEATAYEWDVMREQLDGIFEQMAELEAEGKCTVTRLTDEQRAEWKAVMVPATEDMVKEKLGNYAYLLDYVR